MAENKFDKEKIEIVENKNNTEILVPKFFCDNEKVYNVKDAKQVWWKCPKCGSYITFDPILEGFDYGSKEKQFSILYSWICESCEAEGNFYTVVNPLYISIKQNEEDED